MKSINSEALPGNIISPHFYLRIAGMSSYDLDELRLEKTLAKVAEYFALMDKLNDERDTFAEVVATYVKGNQHQNNRRELLSLKRDIFNLRQINDARLETLQPFFEPDDFLKISQWNDDLKRVNSLLEEAGTAYPEEMVELRERLKAFTDNKNLLNGIAITNPELLRIVEQYRHCDPIRVNKKLRQAETTLTRLISRAVNRPTPLSTLATTVHGYWQKGIVEEVRLNSAEQLSRHHFNQCAAVFLCQFIEKLPEVKPHARVWLNANSSISENEVNWLLNRYSVPDDHWFKLNTQTRAGKVNNQGIVPLIVDLLTQLPNAPTMQKLTSLLCEKTGAQSRQIWQLLEKLEQSDMLRVSFNVDEMSDEYLQRLLLCLQSIPSPTKVLRKVMDGLQSLIVEIQRLDECDYKAKLPKIVAINQIFSNIAEGVRMELKPSSRALIYENVATTKMAQGLSDSMLGTQAREFQLLSGLVALFDLSAFIRFSMVDFFRSHYEVDQKVAFYSFYNAFTAWFKEQVQRNPAGHQDVAGKSVWASFGIDSSHSDHLERILNAQNRVLKLLNPELAQPQEDFQLDFAELESILADIVDLLPTKGAVSLYFMPRISNQDNSTLLQITQVLAGCGKCFSRLLNLFNCDGPVAGEGLVLLQSIRDWQASLLRDEKCKFAFADIDTCLGANGSVREPQTDILLNYFGVVSDRGVESVALNKCMICFDAETLSLALSYQENTIVPLDLGQTHMSALPQLYQLLAQMSGVAAQPFNSGFIDNLTLDQSKAFSQYPGVRLGRILLIPKRWVFRQTALPLKKQGQSEFDYLKEVYSWRKSHNLPEKVVAIFSSGVDIFNNYSKAMNEGKQQPQEKGSPIAKAPIELDFCNPFLLNTFNKEINRLQGTLILEEVLDTPKGYQLYVDDKPRLYEVLTELKMTKTFGVGHD